MMYEEIVADFANRTLMNLEILRKCKSKGDQVYEVTQLINSMLGLLVFPQQEYLDSIPEKTLEELKSEGWRIPEVKGEFKQVENLRELVRLIRNAISHFNIEFIGNGKSEILGITLWNCKGGKQGKKTWQTEMKLDELEDITKRFVDLLGKNKARKEKHHA